MADKSLIEWTEATWNPITGCSVVSPGCTNCYAMKLAGGRLKNHPSRKGLTTPSKAGPVWNGEVRFNSEWLDQPLRWKRPRNIFVCAHSDLFHEDVPDLWIEKIVGVMIRAPQHRFQVLTKRPERMRDFMGRVTGFGGGPLPNVWLGTSIEDAPRLERMEPLRETPAAVRFLSLEPLLGPLGILDLDLIDWVIVGGESGPGARPMHPDWVRDIRDQCEHVGVPFFFKQWGEWLPSHEPGVPGYGATGECRWPWPLKSEPFNCFSGPAMWRVGKKAAGRSIDGREWNGMPHVQ